MAVAALLHLCAAAVLAALAAATVGPISQSPSPRTRTVTIHYRAYDGRIRAARVLLPGAVAVDSVTDLALQYRNFARLTCGKTCMRNWNGPLGLRLQRFARMEIGGSPTTASAAYAARSPLDVAAAIARSCVPLQIWWSTADKVVVDSDRQSGALF